MLGCCSIKSHLQSDQSPVLRTPSLAAVFCVWRFCRGSSARSDGNATLLLPVMAAVAGSAKVVAIPWHSRVMQQSHASMQCMWIRLSKRADPVLPLTAWVVVQPSSPAYSRAPHHLLMPDHHSAMLLRLLLLPSPFLVLLTACVLAAPLVSLLLMPQARCMLPCLVKGAVQPRWVLHLVSQHGGYLTLSHHVWCSHQPEVQSQQPSVLS